MDTLDIELPFEGGAVLWPFIYIRMCFPQDEDLQVRASRAQYLTFLGNLETLTSSAEEFQKGVEVYEPIRKTFGGWVGMSEAMSYSEAQENMESQALDGMVAGGVLRILHAIATQKVELDGGPSLNKVFGFLEHHGESILQQERVWSRRNLIEIWQQFRPVAHLWAAYISLSSNRIPSPPRSKNLHDLVFEEYQRDFASYIHQLYAMARRLQEFGTQFRALRSKATDRPLLDPESTYLLGDVLGWNTYPMRELALPLLWRKALSDYRAPKAF